MAIPKYIRDGLDKQDPKTLDQISDLAEELAAEKRREAAEEIAERAVEEDNHDVDIDELDRRDAPSGATLVTKNIDDRDYYYWNWRAEGTVKSEYIRPVNPADN